MLATKPQHHYDPLNQTKTFAFSHSTSHHPHSDPMSFHNLNHHHNNHHSTTTTTCCCHHQPPQPPFTTPDPLLLSTIISQLLQTPPPQIHPHQFQYPHSILTSLIQRIDALESSLTRYFSSSSLSVSSSSWSSSSSLRHVAARTIQTHFRSYLVRRSRTLRHLQELSLVKSRVGVLKSSFSSHGFVDFDSLSRFASDLLLHLDSIQSGNKMVRDSKRLITREIVEFLEMVDGVCVRKREVLTKTTKNMRTMRNDCRTPHDGRVSVGYGMGSKCGSMNNNDRKLMANLKKRVEKIGRMSRALQDDEVNVAEMEGFEVLENESDVIDRITNKYRMQNVGSVKKNTPNPNAKKRVCIMEDGNVVRVYDDNGVFRAAFKDIDEIDDSSKDRQDEKEEEVESDGGEQSSESSGDGRNQNGRHDRHYYQDGEFTFAAPEPVLMEARDESGTRKSGVKIVG